MTMKPYLNMKIFWVSVLFLLANFSFGAISDSHEVKIINKQLFNEANNYYKNKQYKTALVIYTDLLKEHPNNPSILFNTANTYFKLYKKNIKTTKTNNYLAKSILHYERVLLLHPNDQETRDNLDIINALSLNKFNNLNQGNPLIHFVFFFYFWLSYKQLIFIGLISFLVFSVFLFLFFILNSQKRFVFLKISFIFFIVYLILLSSAIVKYKSLVNQNAAVVTQYQIALKSEPQEDSNTDAKLPQGTKVYIKQKDAGWYYIYLDNGFNGWIPESSCEKINNFSKEEK